jgi:membrane-bound lytic murein transglycosylase D
MRKIFFNLLLLFFLINHGIGQVNDTLGVSKITVDSLGPSPTTDTIIYSIKRYTPDSVYIQRLSALPFDFKMNFNSTVKKYIELYTLKSRKKSEEIIGLGNFYFPVMDKIFEAYNLPLELKYIAIIESSLNPAACSPANAAGLWQFMRPTGKLIGLKINSYVDERRAIIESTEAAAKYLLKLNKIYNDWQLTLAAYNCGSGRVNKAIRMVKGKVDFWKIYPYLPKQTRTYIPAFIGMAYTINYYREHGLKPTPCAFSCTIDTVSLNKNLHFKQVSDVLGLDINLLRRINPQYLKDFIPANEQTMYSLSIPAEHKTRFLELKDSIYASKRPQISNISHANTVKVNGNKVMHRISSGENLWSIAKHYGVTVKSIQEWNNMGSSKIKPGQKLIIYLPRGAKI